MEQKSSQQEFRYPIGQFKKQQKYSDTERENLFKILETFPSNIRKETEHLTAKQLQTPYRDGGWTIKQVVHHCADSHMNSLIRFKLALTENCPTIRPYYEDRWAELSTYSQPLDVSYKIIEGVHAQMVHLLRNLTPNQYQLKFKHPDMEHPITIEQNIALYAWHSQHHLAHITNIKKQNNWT